MSSTMMSMVGSPTISKASVVSRMPSGVADAGAVQVQGLAAETIWIARPARRVISRRCA
jgi:hypothetical protein